MNDAIIAAASLPTETKCAKRSTVNGELQIHAVCDVDGTYYEVPSYYARDGWSVVEAAKSLGLRVLERREDVRRGDVVAEIHVRGGRPVRCVLVKS